MLDEARNSISFSWATIISAIISVTILALILLEEKSGIKKHPRTQSAAFLADKTRAAAFYRIFSAVYDTVNVHFYTDAMREQATSLADISSSSKVLDVGCGTGYTTQAILSKQKTGGVFGIDLTSQQLKRASRNLKTAKTRLSLCRGDAEHLPFREQTFDSVVSVGALEYFADPKRVLKEMARVLKTGGRVVVGAPEDSWFKKTYLNRILYTPSAKELEQFLIEAKLMNVQYLLTGVNTYLGTRRYVVVAAGTK